MTVKQCAPFDQYAHNYDMVLDRALAPSGEGMAYFAKGRMAWLARRLRSMCCHVDSFLDYGCGTGTAAALAFDVLGVRFYTGIDVAADCLAVATRSCAVQGARFLRLEEYKPSGDIDVAFCNGVFHHILPEE